MITVGLTGGIGSGKTFIASLFKKLAIPVYNSDEEAKNLMNQSPKIKNELINRFGKEAYINEQLNRAYIAEKVFKNKTELDWLNSIVHPEVAKHFNLWASKQQHAAYAIKEAAILIESGAYKHCDQIIVINAAIETRIERVMKRDNIAHHQVYERITNQMSDQERNKHANFIINNNGTENVEQQVNKIHNTLLLKAY